MSDTSSSSSETAVEPNVLGHWEKPKTTEAELEWADILTVDLSLLESNRADLVKTVATALERDGFFYVVGHGIDVETASITPFPESEPDLAHSLKSMQLDRQFDLGKLTFDGVDYAEKVKHRAKIAEEGSFNGYKVRKEALLSKF